jgi:O-antigen ligase
VPYFFFLLVTATLFIRPGEIVPDFRGWPIYECLILACLAVSLPGVLKQLSARSLSENPITACVVGLLAAVVLSHLVHFRTWEARELGKEFLKIVIYYLLLVAAVDSEARLKGFLRWLLALVALAAVLALLSAHHVIQLPGVEFLAQRDVDKATGQEITIPRLMSTGIFADPNDLAMILVAGVVIALWSAADPAAGILRFLGLPLVGLFGYAIYATQSRGGLLALMGALLALCHARWGWKRAALIAAVALPLLLVVFKGRITNFDAGMGEGTGRSRVELWSEGLQAFKQQPLFGIGAGNYAEEAGQVAHNSFVHAFTELGFFGGALFLGTFVAALVMLYRLRQLPSPSGRGAGGEGVLSPLAHSGRGTRERVPGGEGPPAGHQVLPSPSGRGAGGEGVGAGEALLPPGLRRLLPYLTAMLAGFAVSMFSLSRNYVATPYLALGLATAYVQIAGGQTQPLPLRFDSRFLKRLAVAGVAFLAFIYVFIRVSAR